MAQRNKFDIDETIESPFSLTHLKRSFVYIRRHAKKMLRAFTASLIATALTLMIPQITQRLLNVSVPDKNDTEVIILAAAALLIALIRIVLVRYRALRMNEVGQDIVYEIRDDLFTHLQKLPFSYFDGRPHGKILVRVVSYVNNVSNLLSNGLIDFILELLNILLIIVFMLITSPQLTLVVLAGLPVLFVIMFSIRPAQRRAWQRVSNKNSNLNAYAAESLNGMRITQIFTREKVNEGVFERLADDSRKSHFRAGLIANSVNPAVEIIAQIIAGMLYITGVLLIKPTVSIGTVVAMGSYAWQFWQPINRLSQIYNEFMNTIAYLERIFDTMDEPVLIQDKKEAYTLPEITGEVVFDNVTFGYEEDNNVLENLSFTVTPGMSVALVGPTGAGKTTIVNLLSRFYDLNSGAIRIDRHNISEVTLNSLRSQMGIMLQDSFVFSGSIAENIRYGRLSANEDEIIKAAKAVHVDDFVSKLNEGYKTEIKERGGFLSQGQKQLLAFARTIISEPKILILDEATSSIDTKTELFVQDSIAKLLKGRTSFIIAHRLSTIRNCDRIMFIKDGGITEMGSHTELMEKKGDYYSMYTSQLLEL